MHAYGYFDMGSVGTVTHTQWIAISYSLHKSEAKLMTRVNNQDVNTLVF